MIYSILIKLNSYGNFLRYSDMRFKEFKIPFRNESQWVALPRRSCPDQNYFLPTLFLHEIQ